jgi:hypothetical protein
MLHEVKEITGSVVECFEGLKNSWVFCNISLHGCVTRSKQNKLFDMKEVLMPIAILGSFGTSLYFFTKVLTDYILKKKMIEKGYVNEDTQAIFKTHTSENRFGSLKWGLLAFCGGVALIVMDYMEVRSNSTLPYGILAVALSIGFLTYYFAVKKDLK